MNLKADYNRCRIPRLVMDPEVWKQKRTEMMDPTEAQPTSSQQEEEDPLVVEAEERLSEKESRKRNSDDPEERRHKRRKHCLLEGWGESSSQEEDLDHPIVSSSRRDWLEEKEEQNEPIEKKNQTRISSWLGSKEPEKEILLEEPKKATPARRTGKLTKKEVKQMKKCHPNISDLIGNKSVPQDIKDVQTKSQTNLRILNVTHTPLLGARKSACAGPNKLDVPRAGIKDACQHQCTANCVHTSPDLRKVRKAHGMMVNGKMEMFGEMSEMMNYWEEQEEKEKEKEPRGQRERGGEGVGKLLNFVGYMKRGV